MEQLRYPIAAVYPTPLLWHQQMVSLIAHADRAGRVKLCFLFLACLGAGLDIQQKPKTKLDPSLLLGGTPMNSWYDDDPRARCVVHETG